MQAACGLRTGRARAGESSLLRLQESGRIDSRLHGLSGDRPGKSPHRDLMKRTLRIVFGCVVLLFALPATWLFVPVGDDAPAPRYVSLSLVTNSASDGGPIEAGFVVSNLSRFRVDCLLAGPQVQMTNVVNGVRGRSTNVAWGWSGTIAPAFRPLGPGEFVSFPAQLPTNAVPWRFGVFVTRIESPWYARWSRFTSQLPSPVSSIFRGDPRRSQVSWSEVFPPPAR